MRRVRNLHVIGYLLTGIVVCSLAGGGLAVRQNSGVGGGWCVIVRVCSILGAVGVICLGLLWVRAVRAITSIATLLRKGEGGDTKAGGNLIKPSGCLWPLGPVVDELTERIDGCFEGDSGGKPALQEQVKDLQIQVQLSQRQKRNTEAIIYSIRDAVVVDEFGRLSMANEAAERLFGFDFDSCKHKPVDEVIKADKGEFAEILRKTRQGKVRASKREMEFLVDGEQKTYDGIFSCIYDQRQQVTGVVAVLHDITREREIARMKNDFVSHVSHELKTPLASISAYSEMLVDGEADDEDTRKEFYSVIQGQAKRLNRLIEDILNISRIESGLVKVEKKAVSPTVLIEEQLQMIKSYAEAKNIEIVAQKPIVFGQVYVDKDMISQVIVNLLSNAVKYTPAGGTVRIETQIDENAGLAKVSVTDTGVGIPKEDLRHVFDKFYRVRENKKQAKGTGLGLNLVKQIVEKVHDGRVFVESEVGTGSTFGFELPLATAEAVET